MTAETPIRADELLAAYADDPTSLSAPERAAVEARLAADPAAARELDELRALLSDVRTHGDVADRGPDWGALEAGIRAAVTATPRRRVGPMLAGAAVVLAAAAALTVWWQRRDRGSFDVAKLVPALPAPRAPEAPSPSPSPSIDQPGDPLDDEVADELGGSDDFGADVDDEELIGRAVERVPDTAADEEGVFPGLDDDWLDDLSEGEVVQALAWLDQQGAG